MDREWFIQHQKGHQGPFSSEEVYRYFHEGRIRPDSLMWKEGLRDWMPLKNCREIAHALDFNLRSEQLLKPLPPESLDLLKGHGEGDKNKDRQKVRPARPQLHQVDTLPPLPVAPSRSIERNKISSESGSLGEWDQIARNFTPNPALENLRPKNQEFEVKIEPAIPTKEMDLPSMPLFEGPSEISNDSVKEWEELTPSFVSKRETRPKAAQSQAASPVATKQRHYGKLLCLLIVVTVAVWLIKIPNVSNFESEISSNEFQVLKQEFAKLDHAKSVRFDKVFSNIVMDRPTFNLAMADDGTKIWLGVSARAYYRFEINFKSVENRVMGGRPIHFSSVGQTHEGLGLISVKDLAFQQGTKVEPGLYEVTFQATRADGMVRWLKTLGENNYSRSVINNFSSYIYPVEMTLGPAKILLAPGNEKEAASQIEAYLAEVKENMRRPLLEQHQNLLTLQSLLFKLGDLMNTYRQEGSKGKAAYIRSYAQEIAPALQVLAVPTPKTQVIDAKAGDPDLMLPGTVIWSIQDTTDMAKKLALLSVQFVNSLDMKKQQKTAPPEKILDDVSLHLSGKLEVIEQKLNAIK